MKATISLLPDHLINQMAAGEVIENPSSVIKELVENSLDAKSTKIEIEIKAGGMVLIRVSDDGLGMMEEDLKMSLVRHATSKISNIEDLLKISTMGFRGEALASIASISKIKIESSFLGESHIIYSEGGDKPTLQVGSRTKGTQVEVRSLFFNVPVRKKFQKSPGQMVAEITKTVMHLALANPKVGFIYISNEKRLIDTKPYEGSSLQEALEKRAQELLGGNIFRSMNFIDHKEGPLHLIGLLGDPSLTRTNKTGQYLFVNNRVTVSPLISDGVKQGYGTRINEKEHPVFVLHMFIDPSFMDINVHPQKRHIRFQDEMELKFYLQKAVSCSFMKKHGVFFDKELQFFPEETLSIKQDFSSQKRGIDYTQKFEQYRQDSLFSGFRSREDFSSMKESSSNNCKEKKRDISISILSFVDHYCFVEYVFCKQAGEDLREDRQDISNHETSMIDAAGTEEKKYSKGDFLKNGEGILIIDLKAATASLFFKQALDCLKQEEKKVDRQMLTIPLILDLMPEEMGSIENNLETFANLGFDLRIIGACSIAIDSYPSVFKGADIPAFISSLLEEVSLFKQDDSSDLFLEKRLAQKICKTAKSRNVNYSREEAKKIIESLFSLPHVFDPLGRNIVVRLERENIDRLFSSKGEV